MLFRTHSHTSVIARPRTLSGALATVLIAAAMMLPIGPAHAAETQASPVSTGIKMLPPTGCPVRTDGQPSAVKGFMGWSDDKQSPLGCIPNVLGDNSGNLTTTGQVSSKSVYATGALPSAAPPYGISALFTNSSDVIGNIWMGGNTDMTFDGGTDSAFIFRNTGAETGVSSFRWNSATVDRSILTLLNTGNVGIGTDTPSVTLEVNGNTNIGGNTNISGNLAVGGTISATNLLPLLGAGVVNSNDGTNGPVHCRPISFSPWPGDVVASGNIYYPPGQPRQWSGWVIFFSELNPQAGTASVCMDAGGGWTGGVAAEWISWTVSGLKTHITTSPGYALGGEYLTSAGCDVTNVATGTCGCPAGFVADNALSGNVVGGHNYTLCYPNTASPSLPSSAYVLAGGVFLNGNHPNRLTGGYSCPSGYTGRRIMVLSGQDYYVCYPDAGTPLDVSKTIGGVYTVIGEGQVSGACAVPNKLTGACSCPSGYTHPENVLNLTGFAFNVCYK